MTLYRIRFWNEDLGSWVMSRFETTCKDTAEVALKAFVKTYGRAELVEG